MANVELTLSQARQNASCFLYIFAVKEYLVQIPLKYRTIIYKKQLNQRILLRLSAKKFLGSDEKYTEYEEVIYNAFIDQYGMEPIEALIRLANGENVAGKNWSEGVFGVGGTQTNFKGSDITVNPTTGYMQRDGKNLPVYDTIYAQNADGTEGVAFQQFYYDEATGKRYMSECGKDGKWYAASYQDADGTKFSAKGKVISDSESGSIWQSVNFSWDDFKSWIDKFVNWLLLLFNLPSFEDTNIEKLTPENTLMNQKQDGFVQEAGFGEGAMILLALAAGGALLATSGKKKSK